ncbi:MAG: PhzF family phenazine biosynthesis protein [Candidatus Krumholzibacteriota bacterium]|nr:PhzF family phenazine biosynthesis protein [Candidatus Krumholzibacteriota bacterium]
MARKLVYEHLDVFARKPFSGNQLAVFPSPGKVTKSQMQMIAREINFSETTFLFPSKSADCQAHLRIFTPAEELPFAGHPTIGSAFVIYSRMKKRKRDLMLELGSGKIPVRIEGTGSKIDAIVMYQPVPAFGSALQNRGQAARAVGIRTFDVLGGGVISHGGLDVLIVEADTFETVAGAQLNIEEASNVLERHKSIGIYLFARRGEEKKLSVSARFFAPGLDVVEDPATGSAAGALGGYLARILKFPADLLLSISQGKEIGRPSSIRCDVHCDRGMVADVRVSGKVVKVGEGVILL